MTAPALASPTDDQRDRSDRVRVLADQVETLYRQAPLGIAVTLVIGAVLAFELYSSAKIGELVVFSQRRPRLKSASAGPAASRRTI